MEAKSQGRTDTRISWVTLSQVWNILGIPRWRYWLRINELQNRMKRTDDIEREGETDRQGEAGENRRHEVVITQKKLQCFNKELFWGKIAELQKLITSKITYINVDFDIIPTKKTKTKKNLLVRYEARELWSEEIFRFQSKRRMVSLRWQLTRLELVFAYWKKGKKTNTTSPQSNGA